MIRHQSIAYWSVLILFAAAGLAHGAADNLIRNGDFTQGVNAKGWPQGWACAGDANVDQTLALDRDPVRGPCARLTCRAIKGVGPSSHFMLEQSRVVALQAGQWYKVEFWARQQGLKSGAVSVSVSETKNWRETGLASAFRVSSSWRKLSYEARAKVDVPAAASRFQIWHSSPGTLWISGVSITPISAPARLYSPVIETQGRHNLIPNSSFECGAAGWGSITGTLAWGNLNTLIGEVDRTAAAQGRSSLKITLNDQTTPVYYFDYFNMLRTPVKMPLAANAGWIAVEKGSDYTLSAWLKADAPDVTGVLAVDFGGNPITKTVKLTRDWQRYSFTLKAREDHCFVAVGPDLRQGPASATVWIDGVQFEKGAAPTAYEPADPTEVAVATETGKYVFNEGEPVALTVTTFNATDAPMAAKVTVHFTDFYDAPAGDKAFSLNVAPQSAAVMKIDTGLTKKGFYRAAIRTEVGGRTRETTLRLTIIAPYRAQDSYFGMNHAYPWNSTLELARRAGMTWMRDWSLKWQDVEPEKGRFTFDETDKQIDRPLALGEQMDLLLPFPSSNWSSSAPASVRADRGYPSIRQRMAYMPRDLGEFGAYVTACVNHYKDRTKTWEILNEPLYTDYSLPRKLGCTPADYVTLLKAAHAAAKQADPKSFVIGGVAGSGGQIGLYEGIVKAGGLDYLDALDIHTYPGLAPPESCEDWLVPLNNLMRTAGKPKPLWLTEIGYYADDDKQEAKGQWMAVLESEKLCAAYYVRLAAIAQANNVAKIFYHAGSASQFNNEGLEGIFFRFGDAPRKMYVAQSVLANLLAPPTRFIERAAAPEGLRAYLFENAGGALAIAWAEDGSLGQLTLGEGQEALDLQGRPLAGKTHELTEYPIYVQSRGQTAAQAKAALRLVKN